MLTIYFIGLVVSIFLFLLDYLHYKETEIFTLRMVALVVLWPITLIGSLFIVFYLYNQEVRRD
jgi:tellurite resistance protein TehA-like permease